MRFIPLTLGLILISAPLWAEELAATNVISAVTLYPDGAMITRQVSFTATPGSHEVIVAGMPAMTDPQMVRVAGGTGVKTGAFWLRTDRMPAAEPALTPAQSAAKTAIEAAQGQLDAAVDAHSLAAAKLEGANAQVSFLTNAYVDGANLTPESLSALAKSVGNGVQEALAGAVQAEAALRPLQKAVDEAAKALTTAQAAYDALPGAPSDTVALSIAVEVTTDGAQSLTLTQLVADASWQPVYDLTLTRGDAPALALSRGVLVTQYTGEDWQDVALTLSTARPSERTEASALWPEYREIFDPAQVMSKMADDAAGGMAEAAMAPAPVVESAMPVMNGDVLTYVYDQPATVATNVENLRLTLDTIALEPKVTAVAVPRYDTTAYLSAKFTNTSGEVFLPGQTFLYRDNNLVGQTSLPLLAAGDEATIGFGAIDGLTLERKMPVAAEGDRGLLSSSTERTETATLVVANLTQESWPVRLLDQVPYAEQEDLEITFTATPEPSETDVDGQRGILAWEFELAAGATQEVTLEQALRWPSGMELR